MRRLFLLILIGAALVACGAQYISDGSCPPGYVCIPICTSDCDAGADSTTPTPDAAPSDATPSDALPIDGQVDAAPDAKPSFPPPPSVTAGSISLTHDVVDAELSRALWSIVMISKSPDSALYIYDVGTKIERKVPLPTTPVAVSVDPTGMKAAVAYDAHVSWIDLTPAVLVKTCDLGSNAFDVALASTGIAYVVPRTASWVKIHAIDLNDCSEFIGTGLLWAGSHIVLQPAEHYLFTADTGLSPSRIHICTIPQLDCYDAEGTNDWGTREYCGNLWSALDGTRLYTACGSTLKLPDPIDSGLAKYNGALQNSGYLQHVAEAPAASDGGRIAILPGTGWWGDPSSPNAVDTKLMIHDTAFLAMLAQVDLHGIAVEAGVSHGRFAFTTPTMNALFVIEQSGAPDAGALFAIETILP